MKYYRHISTDWGKIDRRLRRRELIAFSFVFIIIIFIIILSWMSFNRMKEFENKVEHTHVVLRNFDLLYSAIRDERAFERSYTISGDTNFLNLYKASIDTCNALISRQKNFVSDNPVQIAAINEIQANNINRIKMLDNDLALSRQGIIIPDTKFYYQAKGIMDSIRLLTTQSEERENKLMIERNVKQEIFTSQTRVAITIFSLMIISILFVSMFAIITELNKRISLEEYLKSILDASLSGMQSFQSVRDSTRHIIDFRFIQANLASYKLTRAVPESFIGKTFLEVYPKSFHDELLKKLIRVVETGESANFEFHYFYKEEEGWAQVAAVKLGDGITVTFEDISHTKKTDQEVQSYMKALKRSNRELEQFAYVASHDLQEPLRKIMAFVDRLKSKVDETFSEEANDYFRRIVSSAEKMKSLINDLLLYSRTGSIEADIKPVDLNAMFNEFIADDFEIPIQQKNAGIKIDTLPVLQGSEVQLRQLFHNLFSNSLKFVKPDVQPLITVTAEYLDSLNGNIIKPEEVNGNSWCRIYFTDNGIGFDTEDEKRIFEIFQRIHGKSQYEGTGIGLAICKKIVNIHHGTIIAKGNTKEGGGAVFVITLPMRQHNLSYTSV